MIDHNFIWLGIAINLAGCGGYLIDTLRGKTQPNRVTWLLWTVIGAITVAAQLSEKADWVFATTAATCLLTGSIFFASFMTPGAYWKLGKLDYACAVMAVSTLLIWQVTASGNVALALAITTDLLASLPTIIKAYRNPESENASVYLAGSANALLALLTIDDWRFANYGFLTYTLGVCLVILGFVVVKPRRVMAPKLLDEQEEQRRPLATAMGQTD